MRLSFPGCTLMTLANGHLVEIAESSRSITKSQTQMFHEGWCHVVNHPMWVIYSVDHHFQKCRIGAWQNCQCFSRESVSGYVIDESGSALSGRPIRKCSGVRVSIPSSLSGSGTSGLLLRQASICVSTVYNSSKVSLTLPTTHLRCVFIYLTAASQRNVLSK